MAEYVERKAILETFRLWFDRIVSRPSWEDVKTIIPQIPAADVEPMRHGHWVKSDIPNEDFRCSECGGACWYYDYGGAVAKSKYCPNCGTKMDLECETQ